jgi:hypothetical protein
MSQDLAGGRHQAGERDASDAAHIGSASAALRTFRCPADHGGSGEESKELAPTTGRSRRPGSSPRGWAVAKVVRVGEALTEHAGVSEISRRTGSPTSAVHRIIQELVAVAGLRSDGDHG